MPPHRSSLKRGQDTRKRTLRACDRCRLRKLRCDEERPCSRCKADNSICICGPRKQLREKVYPKGYVDMLEQQQHQLVAGLRSLYRRLQNYQAWPGELLQEAEGGYPLTHDILERLDLLNPSSSNSSICEDFEEDPKQMQHKLLDMGMASSCSRASESLDLSNRHTQSCPSSNYESTIKSFASDSASVCNNNASSTLTKGHLSTTQFQTVGSVEKDTPADWLTLANMGAPEAVPILWKTWLDDITMTDERVGSSHPTGELINFDEFSRAAVHDQVYSGNLLMPSWNDVRDVDVNCLLQDPLSA